MQSWRGSCGIKAYDKVLFSKKFSIKIILFSITAEFLFEILYIKKEIILIDSKIFKLKGLPEYSNIYYTFEKMHSQKKLSNSIHAHHFFCNDWKLIFD